jgi:phenolic acid decarboxylase
MKNYPRQDLSGLLGKHVIYTYENNWQYEVYFKNSENIDYRIHSGPVAGRWVNDRKVSMKALGNGIYRINWVEPTGNIVTMCIKPEERWLHSYFLMPMWVHNFPERTICHENEFVDEMLKYREEGPTWPMITAEDTFANITFLEEVGVDREDVIDCPPDKLPEGYAVRIN